MPDPVTAEHIAEGTCGSLNGAELRKLPADHNGAA
jgi:hypothetical protein